MTTSSLDRALAASEAWLVEQDAPEAEVASHEGAIARSDKGARRWVARILNDQDADGSWGGDLLATAEALLMIHELRTAARLKEQDPGIGRAHDWIRARRGSPGSWADGCTPDRHGQGLCHHFIGGFFSPAPPDHECAETRLRCGARLLGDPEVRLVSSALALRCVMAWGAGGRDERLHLEALRRLVRIWPESPPSGLSAGALLAAIHALTVSHHDEDRQTAELGLRLVGGKQRGDGSWVETDAFQALDVMSAAAQAGIAPDQMRRSLWHGARLLIASQQSDGSWGNDHGARRALIAWRTFRRIHDGQGEDPRDR
jgi:hypothetical protein